MKICKILLLTAGSIAILGSCNSNGPSVKSGVPVLSQQQEDTTVVSGNYVSADYASRSNGYDWIAVMVTQQGSRDINIKIRSRADTKKPTCTLDAVASRQQQGSYRAALPQGNILFTFSGNQLVIAPEKPEDEAAVYFYCSGGGSVQGSYEKLNEEIDTTTGHHSRQQQL